MCVSLLAALLSIFQGGKAIANLRIKQFAIDGDPAFPYAEQQEGDAYPKPLEVDEGHPALERALEFMGEHAKKYADGTHVDVKTLQNQKDIASKEILKGPPYKALPNVGAKKRIAGKIR